MARVLLVLALAALALPATTAAMAAGATEQNLLGKNPGTAPAFSCFSRHYDAAHLMAHPKQSVRDITVFVDSSFDAESQSRITNLEMGVLFRRLKTQFEVSGSCSTIDGQKSLTCGVDCDGGHFDVTTQGTQSLLVAVPDGVRMWDPTASDDADPGELPKGAEFGKDDKLFRLDRVPVEQCRSLMTDEAKTAIFGTAGAGK
ncbi:MAG: hypothetical protein P4M09_27655 [Devosia sp.]|nr:hypothetical protein [Devosia sp.]